MQAQAARAPALHHQLPRRLARQRLAVVVRQQRHAQVDVGRHAGAGPHLGQRLLAAAHRGFAHVDAVGVQAHRRVVGGGVAGTRGVMPYTGWACMCAFVRKKAAISSALCLLETGATGATPW
jgi:hypothetical protein